jgi:PKD repeat protein
MKNKLLFLLIVLLAFPPISIGGEMRTLEIELSFTAPDDLTNQFLGYRLYMEGIQVCETADQSVSKIACVFSSKEGTFDFTVAAYYSDNTESPPSPPFPFTIGSTAVTPADSNTSPPEPPTAVVSSSTAAGNAPMIVTFNGTSSTTTPKSSIVSYNWTFGDGAEATGETTSHTFKTAGTYSTVLTVVDSQGLADSVSTPIIVVGTATTNEIPNASIPTATPPQEDTPPVVSLDDSQSNNELNIEIGTVSINHEWVKVFFENTFSQPVVVASPPTMNGTQAVLVRIRNIDQEGFEIRLQEWNYLDQWHWPETVSYIVIEKGIYTLDNGIKIEAGSFTGSTTIQQVSLQQAYDVSPVILTQVITNNGTDAITNRVDGVSQTSFFHKLQEQETTQTEHPIDDDIGYIAWEPGQGEVYGLLYETGSTDASVTHEWFDLTFQTEFPDLPFFFAGMQTTNGHDTAAVRTQNMSLTATQIKIDEEQSLDSEMLHTTEVMGYFTIGSALQQ